MSSSESQIGIGATQELSLRVSVATLVRFCFEQYGQTMLALERRATLHATDHAPVIQVKSQPFGGAIQIHDLVALQQAIGEFHFDSERSRAEQDFRIFISPSVWPRVRAFCLHHLHQEDSAVLETSPVRELAEEFEDALSMTLQPGQYYLKAVATIVEDHPSPTDNKDARGVPTVRIFRIFEAQVTDTALIDLVLKNTAAQSDTQLRTLAQQDKLRGGRGEANAMLVLPLDALMERYRATPAIERDQAIWFEGFLLDETVTAILEDVYAAKYKKL